MSQADQGRIIHLGKQRERTKEDIEKQRQRLEDEKKNRKSPKYVMVYSFYFYLQSLPE
jgi:hypothetical protein